MVTTQANRTPDTETMLTTIDNPHSPFDEFDEWYAYDLMKGHNTLSLLARLTVTSNESSELDQEQALDYAMDAIINEGLTGVHKKVTRNDYNLED